jgi:hypothetical protein
MVRKNCHSLQIKLIQSKSKEKLAAQIKLQGEVEPAVSFHEE